MLRQIPLPGESIRTLKMRYNDPLTIFRFRMRLWQLDVSLNLDDAAKQDNLTEIDLLLLTVAWPEC